MRMPKIRYSFSDATNTAERPDSVHESMKKQCDRLASVKPGDIHEVASLLQKVALDYYRDVRRQAQQSFYWALGLAVCGTAGFGAAAWFAMKPDGGETAVLAAVGGCLVHVISGINFWLYGRAARSSLHSIFVSKELTDFS